MLRQVIVTLEVQHDLDRLGIAKNAREEKTRARDAKLKENAENERMAKLYREHVLKETPNPDLVQIGNLGGGQMLPAPKPVAKPVAKQVEEREEVGSFGD